MGLNYEKLLKIPNKGQNSSFLMFLRHAERDFSEDPLEDIKKALNENGKKQAISLGKEIVILQKNICFIKSSPIERCIETANAILKGAGSREKVIISKILGDPGPFVSDSKVAFQTFIERGIEEIIKRQFEGKQLPGFFETEKGLKTILGEFLRDMKQLDGVGIYISHDAIIAPVLSHLTNDLICNNNWIGFLDGFSFYKTEDDGYFLLSRNKRHNITREIRKLLNKLL